MEMFLCTLIGILYFATTSRILPSCVAAILCGTAILYPAVLVPILFLVLLHLALELRLQSTEMVRISHEWSDLKHRHADLLDVHQKSVEKSLKFASRFKTPASIDSYDEKSDTSEV
jgi:hypothetical protein